MHLKMSSAKWRPFCEKGDELKRPILLYSDHWWMIEPRHQLYQCRLICNKYNYHWLHKREFFWWCWGVNTMPADALAPKVTRASAGWLYRTDNMCCCSRVNFIYLGQSKSKIQFKMCLYLLWSLKQFMMITVQLWHVILMAIARSAIFMNLFGVNCQINSIYLWRRGCDFKCANFSHTIWELISWVFK